MKTFKHPNISTDWKCPICKAGDDKSVVLIGILGTEEDSIIQAEQFHLDCIKLTYYKKENVLAMKIKYQANLER